MVSIAPNQFYIEGRVLSKKKETDMPDFTSFIICLNKVEHLQGPEGFLPSPSEEITVSMAGTVADDIKKGDYITCNVRKAPGRFFVLPDSIEIKKKEQEE